MLISSLCASGASAQDPSITCPQGDQYIIPDSAQNLLLEPTDSAVSEGSIITISVPQNKPSQMWLFEPCEEGFVVIHPSAAKQLAITVADNNTNNGTRLVLSEYRNTDGQKWLIKQNSFGGCSILSKLDLKKGIDDLGGAKQPGAQIDLWDYNMGDEHLQWNIAPVKNGFPVELPQGKLLEGDYTQSKIYPGTVRHYWVYIPAEYDASKPACLYVQQDGFAGFERRVFDKLIADKAMPITIGLFVQPGYLPQPTGMNTNARRNRDFEYDAVNDNYVRFITEELLPYVKRKEHLNISSDGNDHCIGGVSSGGICAFNAAWHRPDMFQRVFANSGSFVAFRGGHELPTLIRKTEAKPIRAYLTTGTQDMENCAGDWTLLDMEMDKSLKFSGYHYSFHIYDGGHGVYWGPAGLAEGMRYLWKDWPKRVETGASAPRVQDIIIENEGWTRTASIETQVTSSAVSSKGEVFYVDGKKNAICKLGLDGKVSVYASNAHNASGICVDAKDELYAVSAKTGKLFQISASGAVTTYASRVFGSYLMALPDGGFYATGYQAATQQGLCWHINNGKVSSVTTLGKAASGLALRPDRWLLAIADNKSKWIYSAQLTDKDALTNTERFFWLHVDDSDDDAGTTALCYDREGHLFAATRMGIQVCADDGPCQVILPVPGERVYSVCIGGRELNMLFAFTANGIYCRKIKTHTLGAFTPWTATSATPL